MERNTSGTGGIRVALALLLACALLMLPLWWQGAARDTICFITCSPATTLPASSGRGTLSPLADGQRTAASGSPTFFFYPLLPTTSCALCRARCPPPAGHLPPLALAAPPWPCCSPGVCLSVAACHHAPGRALAASLLYLALPYHVAMDLMSASPWREFWAFAWAPLSCWGRIRPPRTTSGLPLLTWGWRCWPSHLPSLLLMMGWSPCAPSGSPDAPAPDALLASPRRPGWGFAWQPPCCCPPQWIRAISMELMRGGMFDYRRNFLDRLPSAWETGVFAVTWRGRAC